MQFDGLMKLRIVYMHMRGPKILRQWTSWQRFSFFTFLVKNVEGRTDNSREAFEPEGTLPDYPRKLISACTYPVVGVGCVCVGGGVHVNKSA